MRAALVVTGFGDAAIDRELDRSPFTVGRDPSCDLVLDAAWVSRRHLVLEEADDGWWVRPESKNEIKLERARLVVRTRIRSGDRIEMGPVSVGFVERDDPLAIDDGEVMSPTMELSLEEVDASSGASLGMLAEVSVELIRGDDPIAVATRAVAAMGRAFESRTAAVLEGTSGSARVLAHAGKKLPRVSKSLLASAEASGGTSCVDDAARALAESSVVMSGVGPAIVSALGPPARGFLYADRAIGADPFTRDDAAFVTVLAHLVGAAIAAAEKQSALDAERRELRRDIDRRGGFGDLVGSSGPMQRLAAALNKVAPTEATVLVTGETGSGKELVARELHRRSRRQDGPFFALNCAALPDSLIESELFGHKRGAFSGADRDRRGIFELAAGGTVFLDEIGELPLAAQAKVLRALDAREVLPLGGGMPIKIDVRLLAATHRDLHHEVQQGRFRQDLLFRIKVFPVQIPPLRERLEDLPALVAHFFARSAEARHKRLGPPNRATLDALGEYSFPGNVRELSHLIEQACIMAEDGEVLDVSHFSDEIFSAPGPATAPVTARAGAASSPLSPRTPSRAASGAPRASGADPIPYPAVASLKEMAGAAEREIIMRELSKDGWNKTRAAKRLQVSLRALMDKIKRYDVREDEP